jgi:hypothetical protein
MKQDNFLWRSQFWVDRQVRDAAQKPAPFERVANGLCAPAVSVPGVTGFMRLS